MINIVKNEENESTDKLDWRKFDANHDLQNYINM